MCLVDQDSRENVIVCPVAFPIKMFGCKGTAGSTGAAIVEMTEFLGCEEGATASGPASGPESRSRSPRRSATMDPRPVQMSPWHGGYPEISASTSDPSATQTPGGQPATSKAQRRSSSKENRSDDWDAALKAMMKACEAALWLPTTRQREAHAVEDAQLLTQSVQDMTAATPSRSAPMSKAMPSTQRSSGLLNSTSQSADLPANVHVPKDGCMGPPTGSAYMLAARARAARVAGAKGMPARGHSHT